MRFRLLSPMTQAPAAGYGKLTRKSRTSTVPHAIYPKLQVLRIGGAMLTSEDYRQLAERCALLAGECTTPGVAEALKMLALDYLTRAAIPAGRQQQQTQRDRIASFPH